jgi:hypothetical protein
MLIVALLLAIGLIAALSGLLLLVAPGRAAAAMGLGSPEQLADGYARFTGVRNLVAGSLLLTLAYTFGVTHTAGTALVVIGAVAWAVTQFVDVWIFLRLGSRTGALAAGALALASAGIALLAWLG